MLKRYLDETFTGPVLHPQLRWHCEPARWSIDAFGPCLRLEPNSGTDFWQRTHYGFQADNGHFLNTGVAGDFVLTTKVRFQPAHQYDQAGLMVRVSPACWLKTSVEYEPVGPSRLGAVVTNAAYSDWSTQSFASGPGEVRLRVRRTGDDFLVEAAPDERGWEQIRVCHLHEGRGQPVLCGLYACSPKGPGFVAEFAGLTIDSGRFVHLKIELTPAQEQALRRLVGILDEAGVRYQFTGGFAGNLHGSHWPLHDLDVDVPREDLPRLAERLLPYTTRPLGLYVDAEFELQLLRAEVEGVAIDVSQAEEAYARVGGQRVPLNTSLAHRQRALVLDLEVWVQPLEELIAYKEPLGRSADLADLRALKARHGGTLGGGY
jgi:regulation of enolase protein 1 (concanavalin A-like superfamily)